MSSSTTGRRPTRPTPAVYRRRRLVALLILLLLVAGVVWGATTLLGRGQDAGAATDGEPAEAAAAREEDATEEQTPSGEVVACAAADLDTTLTLDPTAPAAGSAVSLQVTVRNTGELPCLVDAGPATLAASVSSGSDAVWSSAHCAGDTTNELLLDIGTETSVTVPWSGHRSAEGCPGDQPYAGAGTYRVSLALAGEPLEPSPGHVFTIS